MELIFNGDRSSVLQNERSSRDGQWRRSHNHVNVYFMPLNCTPRDGKM